MNNLFECKLVTDKYIGSTKLDSQDRRIFVDQYRSALEATRGVLGVVYVLRTEMPIPRIKGESEILYIGETKHDVWSRYCAEEDAEMFWGVYSHSIEKYGGIFVDVYQTSNNKFTEKEFLSQYYDRHLELPPINRRG